jgi:hypothetical protein
MSIGPVGPSHTWFSTTTAAGRPGGSGELRATTHRLVPNDPLNEQLTDDDRALVAAATGVDVRADGGIAWPREMSGSDHDAVLGVVGQIALGRANGRTERVSSADLGVMLSWAGFSGAVHDGPMRLDSRA